MKWTRFALLPLLTLAAPAAAKPSLEEQLIAMERASWVAWQHPDVPFWQRFLSDDHVEIHAGSGPTSKAQVIAGIASGACKVESYRLDKFAFRRFGPDTALITYWAAQSTKCGAFQVPSPVWVSSLFQRRGGRWVNTLYVHTAVAQPPGH